MPENPQNKATLVSVGDDGELIFSAHGAQFVVEVDDALERAMLEAKQIKAERVTFAQPSTAHSLPISQIQALIRAGADPTKVAERYRLNDALVRRFSASVQTEKQYAIEQFLAVSAPKESRVHNTAELVERSLAAAQIGMETVTWSATRRGIEPWRITAQFLSAGRRARADWSWNMHNNAILSLNATARRLMGERAKSGTEADVSGANDDDFLDKVEIPGDSVRSARIERAVSAWSHDVATDDAVGPSPHDGHKTPQESSYPGQSADRQDGRAPYGGAQPSEQRSQEHPTNTRHAERVSSTDITPISAIARRPLARRAHDDHDGENARNTPDTSNSPAGAPTPQSTNPQAEQVSADRTSDAQPADTKATKRKSGRSAVPSWDEILFGE